MHDLKQLQSRCRLNYLERLEKYNHEMAKLEVERANFYAQHPDFPKDLLMPILHDPPKEFKITIIY